MFNSNPHGTILLVDDDSNIVDLLKFNLGSEGFNTEIVANAADVDIASVPEMRLVIADAMAQPFTGIDLLTAIKADPAASHIPVIICSNGDGEDAVVRAFDAGADDYIVKPFSLRELIARIKAVLRRHPRRFSDLPQQTRTVLNFDNIKLVIDIENQRVTVGEDQIPLTKTEYQILLYLVKNRNSFFNRNEICNEIWKDEATVNSRIVDTNISRLRKKMGDAGRHIINRYGLGYAFMENVD